MSDFNDPRFSPADAVALLNEGIDAVDVVEPPTVRDPIRAVLRAARERCAATHSLLGLPVHHALTLAQALTRARSEGG